MSEQDLDEIVQITVEEFNQDDRTGKKKKKYLWNNITMQLCLCARHVGKFSETYLTFCDGVLLSSWCLWFYVHPNTMDGTWYIQFTHEEQTDWSIAFLDIIITHNKMAV